MKLAQLKMVCRGENAGFACIQLCEKPALLTVHAHTKDTNLSCPARLVCLDELYGARACIDDAATGSWWVVIIPLLSVDCVVELNITRASQALSHETWSFVFGSHTSRYMSRLLTLRHPQAAALLRRTIHSAAFTHHQLNLIGIWNAAAQTSDSPDVPMRIWRFEARFTCDNSSAFEYFPMSCCVLSSTGEPIRARVITLEEQTAAVQDDSAVCVRRAVFSVALPHACMHAVVCARLNFKHVASLSCSDDTDRAHALQKASASSYEAFYTIFPAAAAARIAEADRFSRDCAHDPHYERWFDEHAATSEQCAMQTRRYEEARACMEHREDSNLHAVQPAPLAQPAQPAQSAQPVQTSFDDALAHMAISVVLPVFSTAYTLLARSINAMLAQSFPAWQLIVLDCTHMRTPNQQTDIARWLHSYTKADARIMYVRMKVEQLQKNQAVAGESLSDLGAVAAGVAQPTDDIHDAFCDHYAHHSSYLAYACSFIEKPYVYIMSEGAAPTPDALWHIAQTVAQHIAKGTPCDVVHVDEDELTPQGCTKPHVSYAASMIGLEGTNYFGHSLVLRTALLDELRAPCDVATMKRDSYDREYYRHIHKTPTHMRCLYGVELYGLALRALEYTRACVHISKILYHHVPCEWLEDEAARKEAFHMMDDWGLYVLQDHLTCMGVHGRAEHTSDLCCYRVRYDGAQTPVYTQGSTQSPQISIIIPTCDHVQLLKACVTSILQKTPPCSYELVLVENNSVQPETFAYYQELLRDTPCARVVTYTTQNHAFNYSALVNYGVSKARGHYLVILNNDTEVIAPMWLEELVGMLQRPQVGIVGAKLLYKDGLIQHAGMIANPNGDFSHINQNLPADNPGYLHSLDMPREYSMVTGALHAMRRSVFDELGGYDESLAVGFNDGDMCLRARHAGYWVVYNPFVELYHREFSSRSREVTDPVQQARYMQEKAYMLAKHPAFFAQPDEFVNAQVNGFSNYYQLQW